MDEVADLRADCARCSALCCVALPYAASADFAYDKPAGRPCRHLDDFSCSIHAQLPERGFPGCTVFDCLGAGQQVTQHTYDGLTWRDRPDLAGEIFAAFLIMRQLQELRWYLRQADRGDQPAEVRRRIRTLAEQTTDLGEPGPGGAVAVRRGRPPGGGRRRPQRGESAGPAGGGAGGPGHDRSAARHPSRRPDRGPARRGRPPRLRLPRRPAARRRSATLSICAVRT